MKPANMGSNAEKIETPLIYLFSIDFEIRAEKK